MSPSRNDGSEPSMRDRRRPDELLRRNSPGASSSFLKRAIGLFSRSLPRSNFITLLTAI